MKICTNKQHRDVHTAKVEQDVVLRVIAERVAEKLGVSLDSPTVSYRAHITPRSTSTGYTYDVGVEIIDDHTAKPAVGPGIEIMSMDGRVEIVQAPR